MWLNQKQAAHSEWGVSVGGFLSTDEMVTSFYCFHLCPSLLATCESSGQIQDLFMFKALDGTIGPVCHVCRTSLLRRIFSMHKQTTIKESS